MYGGEAPMIPGGSGNIPTPLPQMDRHMMQQQPHMIAPQQGNMHVPMLVASSSPLGMQEPLMHGHGKGMLDSPVQPSGGMFVTEQMLGIQEMPGMSGLAGQPPGGGMISLSDLQPGIQATGPHPDNRDLQGLEPIANYMQQDHMFHRAVQAQQVGAASVAALRVMKNALVKEPALAHALSRHLLAPGDCLHVNQRIVIVQGSGRSNGIHTRLVGQEAIVSAVMPNDVVAVRLLSTNETLQLRSMFIRPAAHQTGDMPGISHDLIDMDLLDGVDDILGSDGLMLEHPEMHQGGGMHVPHLSGSNLQSPMHLPPHNQMHGKPLPQAPFVQPFVPPLQLSNLPTKAKGPALPAAAAVKAPQTKPAGTSITMQAELVRRVREDMIKLEAKVPWFLAKLRWIGGREAWKQGAESCADVQHLLQLLSTFVANTRISSDAPTARGKRTAGMQSLLDVLAAEAAAGRPLYRMLDARWEEARGDVDAWLESKGAARLRPFGNDIAKALVALEKAAEGEDHELVQVPLEAMLRNNAAAIGIVKEIIEDEQSDAVKGEGAPEAPVQTFEEMLRHRQSPVDWGTSLPRKIDPTEEDSDATDIDEDGM